MYHTPRELLLFSI